MHWIPLYQILESRAEKWSAAKAKCAAVRSVTLIGTLVYCLRELTTWALTAVLLPGRTGLIMKRWLHYLVEATAQFSQN